MGAQLREHYAYEESSNLGLNNFAVWESLVNVAVVHKEKQPPTKWNWWYDGIIDWMLANPDKTFKECAKEFGVSEGWLRLIRLSDMFQERWAIRRKEYSDKVDQALVRKLTKVADTSLTIIQQRLDSQETSRTPLEDVTGIMESSLKALGYGVPRGGGVTVNTQVGVVDAGASAKTILEARGRIRASEAGAVPGSPPTSSDWERNGGSSPPFHELELEAESATSNSQLALPLEDLGPAARVLNGSRDETVGGLDSPALPSVPAPRRRSVLDDL